MPQELKPIGDYAPLLEMKTLGEFLATDPPAYLLQDATSGQFEALQGEPGDTLPRLQAGMAAPAFDSVEIEPDAIPRDIAYMVLELRSEARSLTLSVGCAGDCDLVVRETTISRRHASIDRRGDTYYLRDLNSTAGTYLNSQRLDARAKLELKPGDRVGLGGVDLTFLDPSVFFHLVQRFLG